MSITTIPKSETRSRGLLWSGLFHFLISEKCDLDYLRGRKGGFVNAISQADNRELFIVKVMDALRKLWLNPDEEYDEIEEISDQYNGGALSREWIALCRLALETDEVAFDTFDLYLDDSSEEL